MFKSNKQTSSSETIRIPREIMKCGDQKVIINNPINNLIMHKSIKYYDNPPPTIYDMDVPERIRLPQYILIDLQTLSYKKTEKYDAPIIESVKILSGQSKIYVKFLKNPQKHLELKKVKEYKVLTNSNTKFKEVHNVIFIFRIKSYENLTRETIAEGPKYKLLNLFENKIFLNDLSKEYRESSLIFKNKKVNLNCFIGLFNFDKLKDNEFVELKNFDSEGLLFESETDVELKSNNKFNEHSLRGMVGLRNLNNTCYVNVALQILMNCKIFIKILTECQIERYINKYNNLGTGGEITIAFRDFLCEYRNTCIKNEGVCGILTPYSFLNKFRTWNKYFDNKEEHDSTDFLFTLLGQLDEDLMSMAPTSLYDVFDFIKPNSPNIKYLSQDSSLKYRTPMINNNRNSIPVADYNTHLDDESEEINKFRKIDIENENHLKYLKENNAVTSILENLFFGKIILRNKCLQCPKTSMKEEKFINIELRKPRRCSKEYLEAELYDGDEVFEISVPIKIKDIKDFIKQEFHRDCLIIKGFEIQRNDETNLRKKTEENFLERSFSNLSLLNTEEEKVKICLISTSPVLIKDISSDDLLGKLLNLEYLFIRICFKNIFFITKYFGEILIKKNEFHNNPVNDENRKFLETKIFNSTKNFLQKLFDSELKMEMKLILKNDLPLISVHIKNKSIFEHKLKHKKLSIINSSPGLLTDKAKIWVGEFNTSFYEYLNYEASFCKCSGDENNKGLVTIMFKSLPLYLIISIKRTEFKDNKVVKTFWDIGIPDILVLDDVKYKMTGLVNHVENLTYSHYTNYCIKEGVVWYCNDSTVKRVKEIDDSNVYFVMFERSLYF